MTKESYIYFSEKDLDYLNKAKLLFGLYIAIFVSLIVLMFVYQIYSYFVTFIIVLLIMYLLYRFVFLDYIYYIRKLDNLKRIRLMKRFDLVDDVLEYFSGEIYKQLFDDDFLIIHKNDAYVLAKIELEDSIYALGLAVYNMDNSTDEVCPSTRELSNELTGYIANSSVIKVILSIPVKSIQRFFSLVVKIFVSLLNLYKLLSIFLSFLLTLNPILFINFIISFDI